jgi:predicted amidophosphoribosyltransferase
VATITCPHCRKTLESGPTYCPHCYLKLPGVIRAPEPAARPRAPRDAEEPRTSGPRISTGGSSPRVIRGREERKPRLAKEKPATSGGQCPACSHPISSRDEWCKWCHWPVNRK